LNQSGIQIGEQPLREFAQLMVQRDRQNS
jgi:hypothetical protein